MRHYATNPQYAHGMGAAFLLADQASKFLEMTVVKDGLMYLKPEVTKATLALFESEKFVVDSCKDLSSNVQVCEVKPDAPNYTGRLKPWQRLKEPGMVALLRRGDTLGVAQDDGIAFTTSASSVAELANAETGSHAILAGDPGTLKSAGTWWGARPTGVKVAIVGGGVAAALGLIYVGYRVVKK